MDRVKWAGAIFLTSALVVGGCGNFGKNADKPNREDASIIHEDEKEGGSMETGDGYGFNSFDLEIEVDGKDAIDADYEITKNAEGEYENKLTNEKFKNEEAMNALDKLFVAILLTKDTPQQEAIDKILEYYKLDNYSKFELDVKFDDGTNLLINEVK